MPSPEKFRESLLRFQVAPEIVAQIEEGCEDITSKTVKKKRAAFFRRALDIMTVQAPHPQMQAVLEWGACCKSGAREKASKQFAKDNAALMLAEKLAKIPKVPNMGRPVLNEDDSITVHAVYWLDEGRYRCACSQFSGLKLDAPVSRNYCYCCAGHFKHHYEIMLGVKLETVEIVSSALESMGEEPCVLRYVAAGGKE